MGERKQLRACAVAARRKRQQADLLRVLIALLYGGGTAVAARGGLTGAEVWAVTMVGLLALGAVLFADWIAGGDWRG